jgi:GT2 family glycosyltransferase
MAVSVLIANDHVYDELDRALGSLAPQLEPDDRVVVVDQESDPARLGPLAARYARVRFLPRADNLGFARAINLAAGGADTRYLLWLNPDCILLGPVLRDQEQYLDAHPHVGVAGPCVLNADGTRQASARRFPTASTALGGRSTWLTHHFPHNPFSARDLPGRTARDPLRVDWVAGSCLLTRRSTFEALGGLDERFFLYWEDADYCRRVTAAGQRVMYVPASAVQHVGGASAARDRARAIRAFHASAAYLFRKHAGPVGRLLSPAVTAALWLRGEWRARAK